MNFLLIFLLLCLALPTLLAQSNGLIAGSWKVLSGSIKIDGETIRGNKMFNPHRITMDIEHLHDNSYRIFMQVRNSFDFEILENDKGWTKSKDGYTTHFGLAGSYKKFEEQMSDLVKNPDSVEIITKDDRMIINKKNSQATFSRVET